MHELVSRMRLAGASLALCALAACGGGSGSGGLPASAGALGKSSDASPTEKGPHATAPAAAPDVRYAP